MAKCVSVVETKDGETEVRDPRLIVVGADVSPAAIDGEGTRAFADEMRKGLSPIKSFVPPYVTMGSEESTKGFYAYMNRIRRTLHMQMPARLDRRYNKLVEKHFGAAHKWSTEPHGDGEQFVLMHDVLERPVKNGAVGGYELNMSKLDKGFKVDPKIEAFAKEYKERVTEDLYKITSGKTAKAWFILKSLGIEDNPRNLKKIMDLQGRIAKQGIIPSGVDPQLLRAAQLTEGMFDIRVAQDTSIPFDNGHFLMMPIPRERAVLLEEIKQKEKQLAGGIMDPGLAKVYQATIDKNLARLQALEAAIQARESRLPGQTILPRRYFSQMFLAKDPAGVPFRFETDIDTLHKRLVHGAMGKRWFDVMLDQGREAISQTQNKDLQKFTVDWINAMRGVKGFQQDAWIRATASRFSKYGVSEDMIRKDISELMKFQAVTKLFVSPRFALVNSMQSIMTLLPLVGPKIFFRAVARAYQVGGEAWQRAGRAGLLDESGVRFLRESESYGGATKLDWFIKNWPIARVATLTESINRVTSYEAGRMLDEAGQARLKPILRTLFTKEEMSAARLRHEYGLSMVDATQFILAKEGRPLAFVGGAAQQLVGQFRTFGIAYTTLLHDMWKHDKRSFARAMASLWFVGGLPAFPFYDFVRNRFLKHAGIDLPEWNGFSGALSLLGAGAWIPHTIDVTTSVEPFNLPRSFSARDLASTALGPTFGPMVGLGEDVSQYGPGSPQAIKTGMRMVSPEIVAAGEAGTEWWRGGVSSPAGMPIAKQTGPQLLARGLGIRGPIKGTYIQARRDLSAALERGDWKLVDSLKAKYRAEGLIIPKQMISRLKGEIKANKTKSQLDEMGDIFFPSRR